MPSAAREYQCALEDVFFRHGAGFDQPLIVKVADERRHAVITQAASVNLGDEGVSQRVHLDDGGHHRRNRRSP